MTTKRNPEDAGYIVPMVLIVLAIMSLSLWSSLSVLTKLNADLADLMDQSSGQRSALKAEARVLHLMLAEPMGSRGIRVFGIRESNSDFLGLTPAPFPEARDSGGRAEFELRADGRTYVLRSKERGQPDIDVQLVDDAGLFNLNTADETVTARYLVSLGLDQKSADDLAAALIDYTDPDDLRRLNGAERAEYEKAGLPPPLNRALSTRDEVWGIIGWQDRAPTEFKAKVERSASVSLQSNLFNLNTAGPPSLAAIFGLSQQEAAALEEMREDRVLRSELDMETAFGRRVGDAGDMRLYAFPSRRLRIHVRNHGAKSSGRSWSTTLTLTEPTADRPFLLGGWTSQPGEWVEREVSERGVQKSGSRTPAVAGLENFPDITTRPDF